jgi:hypothetical protein
MPQFVGLYYARSVLCSVAFTFFGYLSPVLNSIKAVVSGDEEGLREYTTYWVVLSSLVYLEVLLTSVLKLGGSATATASAGAPEVKVLFVLWLTLPRFQGAYRIYTVLLQPYFAKYEDDIDKKVEEIAGQVRTRASRQLKTVLWQLFLAPNDGLLGGLPLPQFAKTAAAMAVAAVSSSSLDTIDTITTTPVASTTPTRQQIGAIQKLLLAEFTKLLARETPGDEGGICVFAAGTSQGLVSPLAPCQLTLEDGALVLCSVQSQGEKEVTESWSVTLPLSTIVCARLEEMEAGEEMEAEEEVDLIPVIRLTTSEGDSILLREEEQEGGETEALLAGLTVLLSERSRPSRKL